MTTSRHLSGPMRQIIQSLRDGRALATWDDRSGYQLAYLTNRGGKEVYVNVRTVKALRRRGLIAKEATEMPGSKYTWFHLTPAGWAAI